MLHCWQPKRKHNLNGCQTVKKEEGGREIKLSVGIYSLRKEKATAACSGGRGRGWRGPRLPSRGRRREERRRSWFRGTHGTHQFLEKDLGLSQGSVMLRAPRKLHLGKSMGAKMCKNPFAGAGLVIPVPAGASPPARPWASGSGIGIAAAAARLRQPSKCTQSPVFLVVQAGCAACFSSCQAFPITGPGFSAVCRFFCQKHGVCNRRALSKNGRDEEGELSPCSVLPAGRCRQLQPLPFGPLLQKRADDLVFS